MGVVLVGSFWWGGSGGVLLVGRFWWVGSGGMVLVGCFWWGGSGAPSSDALCIKASEDAHKLCD